MGDDGGGGERSEGVESAGVESAGAESAGERSESRDPTGSSRRRFLGGVSSAALAVASAGCSTLDVPRTDTPRGSHASGDGAETTQGTTVDGTTTADSITIAAVDDSGLLLKRLLDDYVVDDTEIDVEVDLFGYADLFNVVWNALSSRSGKYDVVYVDDPWFPLLARHLDPIRQWLPEDLPESQFLDTVLDIATWPTPEGPIPPRAAGMAERLRGLVVLGNTQLFAYNAAHYERVGERGPPETWDDVLRIGRRIERDVPDAHGYTIRGRDGNPIVANYFSFGTSAAGRIFDDDWRFRWNSEAGVAAANFYLRDLTDISPSGVAQFSTESVQLGLANGTAAQSLVWPSASSLLLDPESAPQAGNIEFTTVPRGQTRAPQLGNWIAGVNRHVSDARKRAAGRVLRSFVSREAQQRYVELGGIPFRHDTFEQNLDAEPFFPALYESLQIAQWRPRTPLWSQLKTTLGTQLHDVLRTTTAPAEAMRIVERRFTDSLRRAGYYR
jgi:multiple sugar transport system substrate-binding protein